MRGRLGRAHTLWRFIRLHYDDLQQYDRCRVSFTLDGAELSDLSITDMAPLAAPDAPVTLSDEQWRRVIDNPDMVVGFWREKLAEAAETRPLADLRMLVQIVELFEQMDGSAAVDAVEAMLAG